MIDLSNPGDKSEQLKEAFGNILLPLSKTDVGLDQVDNTSDSEKPPSEAILEALETLENTLTSLILQREPALPVGTSTQFIAGNKTLQNFTKALVGLSNVDNTSDANKPVSSAVTTALASKANLSNPVFTGVPEAPTASSGNNSNTLATTAFVHHAIEALTTAAPELLDTFAEIAEALGNDPNFATTITAQIATKLSKSQNLSDLTDKAAARAALQLGSAAQQATSAFATAAQGTKADTALQGLTQGTNITIDATDPKNPVISSTAGLNNVSQGSNVTIDYTDPKNPVISATRALNSVVQGDNISIDTTNPANPIISALVPLKNVVEGNNVTIDYSDPENPTISASGNINSLVEGTNIVIDTSDPQNPIINSYAGLEGVVEGNNVSIDYTDPKNPVISAVFDSTGFVSGPVSSTNSGLVLFSGINGKTIKDSGKFISDFATAAQGTKADSALQPSDVGNSANKIPILDGDGLLSTTVLPALALMDIYEVASESAMTALNVQRGDIAIRTDINKTYILSQTPASLVANWKELRTPTDLVQSVAGLMGTISSTDLKTALSLTITDIANLQTELNNRNLPTRLYPACQAITDWNSATSNGWYQGSNATNQPSETDSTIYIGTVVRMQSVSIAIQTVTSFGGSNPNRTYRRTNDGSSWSAWQRVYLTKNELDTLYTYTATRPVLATSSNVVAVAGQRIYASGTAAITTPPSPVTGDTFAVFPTGSQVTIVANSGQNIETFANIELDKPNLAFELTYVVDTWKIQFLTIRNPF